MLPVSSEKPPRSAFRVGCLLSAFFLLVILLIVVAGVIGWYMQSARQLRDEFARIRANGEPTNAEELASFYDYPPPEKDVTKLWLEAVAPLTGAAFDADVEGLPVVGNLDSDPPIGSPWPDIPRMEKLLAKYRPCLEKLHEAERRGGAARYPVHFEAGILVSLNHVSSLRAAARLIALEAHVRARRSDNSGTVESIETMLAIANSYEREPILDSQVMRVGANRMTYELVEKLLRFARFSDADLSRLQQRFHAINHDEGFLRAMMGERVLGTITLQAMNLDDKQANSDRRTLFPFRNEIARVYLEWMQRVVDAARRPLPQRLDEAVAVEAELDRAAGHVGPIGKSAFHVAAIVIPSVRLALSVGARGNAEMQLASTGIAVERFRRKHGEFPGRLEQLVPEFLPAVPNDPFDGKPLRFAVRDGKAIVYSVGPDCIDNGGRNGPGIEKSDIVFTLTAPNQTSRPAQH